MVIFMRIENLKESIESRLTTFRFDETFWRTKDQKSVQKMMDYIEEQVSLKLKNKQTKNLFSVQATINRKSLH